jgi:V/A-type H+-transporting ATPase subunit C
MGRRRPLRNAVVFGYPVGRVRVLEAQLLTNATLERLLDAEDFLAQKRVLADTAYGASIGPCETVNEVEEAIEEELTQLYALLESSRLPEPVVRLFRAPYDYRNMKARLKAEALGTTMEGLSERHGLLDAALFGGPLEMLPEKFRALDAEVRDNRGEIDQLLVDPVVDRAMFVDMLDAAEASESAALKAIVSQSVSIANARTLLRAKRFGWSADRVAAALAPGATLAPERLMSMYSLPIAEIADRLASTTYFPGVTAEEFVEVARLDVVADNLLTRSAREARRRAVGVEPVAGYVIARRSEIIIVRTLLVGKMAGMSADELRTRVRELYA